MRRATLVIEPLWQCYCRPRVIHSSKRAVVTSSRPKISPSQCAHQIRQLSHASTTIAPRGYQTTTSQSEEEPHNSNHEIFHDLHNIATHSVYARLNVAAIDGHHDHTRRLVEHLVSDRHEAPNISMYNALIICNVHCSYGAAWRVNSYLAEMQNEEIQPDLGTCHAVLKVLAVHPDHLLRNDTLAYMRSKWFGLSADGHHDVTAGWIREGCFELALQSLDTMRREGVRVSPWLLDMLAYNLCDAGEIDTAYRIMRERWERNEPDVSRTLWHYLLDAAADARCHPAADFVWRTQVQEGQINANSGVCLNVLATAVMAGDPSLSTDVFTHLSKRGEKFTQLHYQLLIDSYMTSNPPDLKRAFSILSLMKTEKIPPTAWQTRSLFLHIRDNTTLIAEAFSTLRDLHEQNKEIPIAALNLIIECYVHQNNLAEAMKVYKQIHTFTHIAGEVRKSFANTETFALLFRACRSADPPAAEQANFLVSEMLALRIKPDVVTVDRLILVFLVAARYHLDQPASLARGSDQNLGEEKSTELVDWAMRHFKELESHGWVLRQGTLELLVICLARLGDQRCWDVLQFADDRASQIERWSQKGEWIRKRVQEAWEQSTARPAHIQDSGQHQDLSTVAGIGESRAAQTTVRT